MVLEDKEMKLCLGTHPTNIGDFSFQKQAINETLDSFLQRETDVVLVNAVTSSGKRIMTINTMDALTQEAKYIFLVLTPGLHLSEQFKRELKNYPNLKGPVHVSKLLPSVLQNGLCIDASRQIVSNVTTRAYTDTEHVMSIDNFLEVAFKSGFNISIIIDEIHSGTQKDDTALLEAVTKWQKYGIQILGNSATLGKAESQFHSKGFRVKVVNVKAIDPVNAGIRKPFTNHIAHGFSRKRFHKKAAINEVVKDCTELFNNLQNLMNQFCLLLKEFSSDRLKQISKIPFAPLMLIQIENTLKGDENDAREVQRMLIENGFRTDEIYIHREDDGMHDAKLNARCDDLNTKVVVFKVAAGTGLDTERAYILGSLRPVSSSILAKQVVGRPMRVPKFLYEFLKEAQKAKGPTANAWKIFRELEDGKFAPLAEAHFVTAYDKGNEKIINAFEVFDDEIKKLNIDEEPTPYGSLRISQQVCLETVEPTFDATDDKIESFFLGIEEEIQRTGLQNEFNVSSTHIQTNVNGTVDIVEKSSRSIKLENLDIESQYRKILNQTIGGIPPRIVANRLSNIFRKHGCYDDALKYAKEFIVSHSDLFKELALRTLYSDKLRVVFLPEEIPLLSPKKKIEINLYGSESRTYGKGNCSEDEHWFEQFIIKTKSLKWIVKNNQWVAVRCPSGKKMYPDFIVCLSDGSIELHEPHGEYLADTEDKVQTVHPKYGRVHVWQLKRETNKWVELQRKTTT